MTQDWKIQIEVLGCCAGGSWAKDHNDELVDFVAQLLASQKQQWISELKSKIANEEINWQGLAGYDVKSRIVALLTHQDT